MRFFVKRGWNPSVGGGISPLLGLMEGVKLGLQV